MSSSIGPKPTKPTIIYSSAQSSLPTTLPNPIVMASPCAACKILRRRCVEKCFLAPYFPPSDQLKFTIAHKVFGASNIIKFLQELPESHRADAVSSMVYEASARIRDPVYGCTGVVCRLQEQVSELQARLAKAQAELIAVQCQQQANLKALSCMQMSHSQQPLRIENFVNSQSFEINGGFLDDNNIGSLCDPLWTRENYMFV